REAFRLLCLRSHGQIVLWTFTTSRQPRHQGLHTRFLRPASGRRPLHAPNFDLEVSVRSGGRIWIDLSTLVFKEGRTHPRLIVHLARDITQRKQQEEL